MSQSSTWDTLHIARDALSVGHVIAHKTLMAEVDASVDFQILRRVVRRENPTTRLEWLALMRRAGLRLPAPQVWTFGQSNGGYFGVVPPLANAAIRTVAPRTGDTGGDSGIELDIEDAIRVDAIHIDATAYVRAGERIAQSVLSVLSTCSYCREPCHSEQFCPVQERHDLERASAARTLDAYGPTPEEVRVLRLVAEHDGQLDNREIRAELGVEAMDRLIAARWIVHRGRSVAWSVGRSAIAWLRSVTPARPCHPGA